MIKYEVDFEDLNNQIHKLGQFNSIARDELSEAMQFVVGRVERDTKINAPVGATGELRSKVSSEVTPLVGMDVQGVVRAGTPYALPVEMGQRPHFPPLQPIAYWAGRKLGVSGWDGIRVAISIARRIAARGVKGKFFLRRAFTDNRKDIETRFKRAADIIMARMAVR